MGGKREDLQEERQATHSNRGGERKKRVKSGAETPQNPSRTPPLGFLSASRGPPKNSPSPRSPNHSIYSKLRLVDCGTSGILVETFSNKFNEGMLVEVSSEEEGFQGSWYTATLVEKLSNGNFLVEHKFLRNDEDTEFLREEVDCHHIRPFPPNTQGVDSFDELEEVDVWHNDGWWMGMISEVLEEQKYIIYFWDFNEEWVFEHSDLRPHMEWIAGNWVSASRDINSQAGGDNTVGISTPAKLHNLSPPRTHDLPVSDSFTSNSHAPLALPSSAHSIVEDSADGSGIDGEENHTSHLNETSSFNYTEIALQLEDGSIDEAETAADPAFVTVNGYRVKQEFASLLESLLLKYGDIANDSLQKSSAGRSSQLERLCEIYQKLEKKVFTGITKSEIDSMLVEVQDLEIVNLEVGWLRKRLEDISDSLAKSKAYPALKKKKEEFTEDLEAAKERIQLAKEELEAIRAEGEMIDEELLVIKAKTRMFQQSLVYGLL